ncbi:HET-domain-containing protein [Decorospora gaudefroyi]|uniref:HET-domain-containing protein n=1 Tax=Decorospora gaudefroyi TaxID=184978 RepID=A0A6A5K4L8_9PLEO|nr:HET-domain-containing protein [Decorospora gaudefroyi]
MRLLNVHTRQLEEFFGEGIPLYAILSHTWGAEEKQGYAKIDGCCRQAARHGLRYVWIDTCCIDKMSSAELSEAINSMFRWYEAANLCYDYLEDVASGLDAFGPRSKFQTSRWFTRGWTLQELLAPRRVLFFASDWTPIFDSTVAGSLEGLQGGQGPMRSKQPQLLSGIAGIPESVLQRHKETIFRFSSVQIFLGGVTTRIEDMAYCLLGILGVNMPLLYGEGDRAFVRLQEVILSSSDDISVLAWGYDRLSWKLTENQYHS